MNPVDAILADVELPEVLDETLAMKLAQIAYAQGHQDGTADRLEDEGEEAVRYIVVFDFPDGETGPFFAEVFTPAIPAISPSLESATRFESERAAQAFLDAAYGPMLRPFGCVAEVAA